MRIAAFRIQNFRSIVDTGWVDLSADGITALVGQNEAGKTSVLRAIEAFQSEDITQDDQRSDDSTPEIYLSFELPVRPSKFFEGLDLPPSLDGELKERRMRINLLRTWDSELQPLEPVLDPEQHLAEFFPEEDASTEGDTVVGPVSGKQFAREVLDLTPDFILFNDDASLLPDRIDLSDIQEESSEAEGLQAVRNFIVVAELETTNLGNPHKERGENRRLSDASERITEDFQGFWEQTVGKQSKVSFECVLKRHDVESGRGGDPYLEFLVNDNKEKLHLKQRSKGLQWFLSFYLQLRASAKKSDGSGGRTFFLIDEPGGSLHAKAQENVLRVLEALKKDIQVIYTTHSPFLINIEELGRILVAERSDDEDESSPTLVKDVHRLGAENEDSLFPVYTAIGADLSHQQVIHRRDNVLLEEVSAYHYLRAFWLITQEKAKVHFLPGNGATTVGKFANLLTGWGLRYIVFVDNDDAGVRAIRDIKKHLYPGRDDLAANDLLALPVGSSVEDVLMPDDFRRWVLQEPDLTYTETNGEYAKGKSKGILAARFYSEVSKGNITAANLSESIQNIGTVVDTITTALKKQKSHRD